MSVVPAETGGTGLCTHWWAVEKCLESHVIVKLERQARKDVCIFPRHTAAGELFCSDLPPCPSVFPCRRAAGCGSVGPCVGRLEGLFSEHLAASLERIFLQHEFSPRRRLGAVHSMVVKSSCMWSWAILSSNPDATTLG